MGALVGAAAVITSIFVKHWLDLKEREKVDAPRKRMLLQMLKNPPPGTEWRKFETLSRVIGASREDTTRLLISVGARGNEKESDVWALESDHPLL